MKQYQQLLSDILMNGVDRGDRTGTGTRSLFGRQMRFNLNAGFPLVTTKAVKFSNVIGELLWMISGSTNVNDLHQYGVHIWDQWADQYGDLGPVYGAQWSGFLGVDFARDTVIQVDQLKAVMRSLQTSPESRRHVVSAWNPAELPNEHLSPQENAAMGRMALAPCHCLFQFFVANNRLSCQLYQRSADSFIGVPYNIASYALLTHMVADQLDLEVGEFIHTFGDVHIYHNHFDQVRELLVRKPQPLPTLKVSDLREGKKAPSLFHYTVEDFWLEGYAPHPHIPAPVAV